MDIKLVKPTVKYKNTFLDALLEFEHPTDKLDWNYLGNELPTETPIDDFGNFVKILRTREYNPPEGFVADTVYWAIYKDQVLGRIALRHANDEVFGHIGYVVRPSCRNKRVATQMLQKLCLTSKAKEIAQLLVTCDIDNLASQKVVLKNNGVYRDTISQGTDKPPKKRYWIFV